MLLVVDLSLLNGVQKPTIFSALSLDYDHTLVHLRTVISTPLARKTIKLLFVLVIPSILLIIVNYPHRLEL